METFHFLGTCLGEKGFSKSNLTPLGCNVGPEPLLLLPRRVWPHAFPGFLCVPRLGGALSLSPQQAQLPLTSSQPGCSNPQPTVGSWQGPHVCPWVSTIMLGPFQQGWWLLPALVPWLTLMLLVFEELPSKEERPNNQGMRGKHHHHKRVRPAGRRGQQGVSQPLLGLSQLRDRGQATRSHRCSIGTPPSGSGCCCRGAWGRPGPRQSPSGSSRGCGCR